MTGGAGAPLDASIRQVTIHSFLEARARRRRITNRRRIVCRGQKTVQHEHAGDDSGADQKIIAVSVMTTVGIMVAVLAIAMMATEMATEMAALMVIVMTVVETAVVVIAPGLRGNGGEKNRDTD